MNVREAQEQSRLQLQETRLCSTPQAKTQEPQPTAESQVVTPQKADHHIQIMKDTLAGVKRGAEQLEDVMDQEPIRAVKVAQ